MPRRNGQAGWSRCPSCGSPCSTTRAGRHDEGLAHREVMGANTWPAGGGARPADTAARSTPVAQPGDDDAVHRRSGPSLSAWTCPGPLGAGGAQRHQRDHDAARSGKRAGAERWRAGRLAAAHGGGDLNHLETGPKGEGGAPRPNPCTRLGRYQRSPRAHGEPPEPRGRVGEATPRQQPHGDPDHPHGAPRAHPTAVGVVGELKRLPITRSAPASRALEQPVDLVGVVLAIRVNWMARWWPQPYGEAEAGLEGASYTQVVRAAGRRGRPPPRPRNGAIGAAVAHHDHVEVGTALRSSANTDGRAAASLYAGTIAIIIAAAGKGRPVITGILLAGFAGRGGGRPPVDVPTAATMGQRRRRPRRPAIAYVGERTAPPTITDVNRPPGDTSSGGRTGACRDGGTPAATS